ncbi:transposase, partial [Lactobacillus helveticus]|uniref:transposase n=1 Tax=Lactobacillus helveticus TaxID=1587 RepID=UPI0020B68718
MHGKTIVVAIIGEDDICFEEVSCLPKYAKKKQALSIMKLRAFCMPRKSKFSYEVKLKAVKQYLNGEASFVSIAKAIGAGKTTFRQWIYAFKDQGAQTCLL